RLTTGVVRTLEVNERRMRAALESGFSQATDLAEYIMQSCGIDYRTAYRVVGHAVRQASAAGLRGGDIDGVLLDASAAEITGRPLRRVSPRPRLAGPGPPGCPCRPPHHRARDAASPAPAAGSAPRGTEDAMTEPGSTSPSLPASVGVVNVGLPLFADAIAEQG